MRAGARALLRRDADGGRGAGRADGCARPRGGPRCSNGRATTKGWRAPGSSSRWRTGQGALDGMTEPLDARAMHARLAGRRGVEWEVLRFLLASEMFGSTPRRGSRAARRILAEVPDNRELQGWATRVMGTMLALAGRVEEARGCSRSRGRSSESSGTSRGWRCWPSRPRRSRSAPATRPRRSASADRRSGSSPRWATARESRTWPRCSRTR